MCKTKAKQQIKRTLKVTTIYIHMLTKTETSRT